VSDTGKQHYAGGRKTGADLAFPAHSQMNAFDECNRFETRWVLDSDSIERHTEELLPASVQVPRVSMLKQLREIAVDELWAYRELAYQLTLRDIKIRYKQAVMGFAWAILMPALIIGAGALVRYAMAYLSGGEIQMTAIAGMAVKALPWAFFVGAIGFATGSLISNRPLLTKIYFPREVLPVSSTLAQAFDSSLGTVILIIILPFLGVTYGWTTLWAPYLMFVLFTFTLGTSLLLGCANLFFRDVKYIVQVILTFGIFLTPVFFEPSMFGPRGSVLMMLNPLSPVLEGIRLSVVEHHDLLRVLTETRADGITVVVWSPWYLAYGSGIAIFMLLTGALIFHRYERVFAEYA
jgi:lipopolysaccharide transport system permease protein